MHVVCTAGHVDHGKSTIVRALTGMEPDRFAEEQERGLTIDLGFAWTQLEGTDGQSRTVAFVDLPGHERFIANMLAGAGATDLALFVVAADEGWMPQSQEHLDILDLLGVRRGLVVVTKADTVDSETLAAAEEELRKRLAQTVLEGADVVSVSGLTGTGMDELTQHLCALVDATPAPPDRGRPRLWVDRSFSIRGAGTVVTGTLAGGSLSVGEEVAILPADRTARIRGMQSLKFTVDEAPPGSRVAVNLGGIDREDVRRGDALGLPGQWLAVSAFDAWVRALPGHAIDRRGAWHLHAGSGERLVTIHPYERGGISGEGFIRIEMDHPIALCAGDRFVLREAGRRATTGGGVVLDCDAPPRARGRERGVRMTLLSRMHTAVADGDLADVLSLQAADRGAIAAARAAAAVGLTAEDAREAARARGLLPLGNALAHPDAARRWASAVGDALARYHQEHPLERTAPRNLVVHAALTSGCPSDLGRAFVDLLIRLGRVAADGPGLRLPDHRVQLDPGQAAASEQLLAALDHQPFAPPRLSDAAATAGASPELVRELEASGAIVRLNPDLAVTAAAVDEAVARLKAAYGSEGPLTAARAKEILGTSRKYALPLLEELDRRGVTRRRGDLRDVVQ